MLSDNVLGYGSDKLPPERLALRAGRLDVIFENGDLRYIKLGATEILRRVYVAVRDRNWGTVPPVISNLRVQKSHNSFLVHYDVDAQQGNVDFSWRGTISGDSSGTIKLTMEGKARSTFMRSRIGFCILHPMSCSGAECRIEHVDGTVEQSCLPLHIAPQLAVDGCIQPVHPFDNMSAVSHQVQPGLWAEVRFEGDVFEMEDQRNWTDASYKTYGTPLSLPFPVEVRQGTRIAQSVTLRLEGDLPKTESERPGEALTLAVGDQPSRPVPRIGLGVASHGQALNAIEIERIRKLSLSHLRVDLDLSCASYRGALQQAAAEADALGAQLEIALHLSDAAAEELEVLIGVLQQVRPSIHTWLIFHHKEKSTSKEWVDLGESLTRYESKATIGSGTDANFAELNRDRSSVDAVDLVTYSINPQVHASDNASLVETLQAQGATVQSALQFSGGRDVMVSPVTLRMRFNPNATGPEQEPRPGELPPQVDERQMSLFGAGWTLGSLKYISECGVYSATYYETTGWRGVMETAAGSPLPEEFQSLPGSVYPLYHVLADVLEFAGGTIVPTTSTDPLMIDGLALRKHGETRVLVANLTGESKDINVLGLSNRVRLRGLDATIVEEAMLSPEVYRRRRGSSMEAPEGRLDLHLLPWAVVRIDSDLPGESS